MITKLLLFFTFCVIFREKIFDHYRHLAALLVKEKCLQYVTRTPIYIQYIPQNTLLDFKELPQRLLEDETTTYFPLMSSQR